MWSCTLTTPYLLWGRALGNVSPDNDGDYEVDSNDEEIKDGGMDYIDDNDNHVDNLNWTNFTQAVPVVEEVSDSITGATLSYLSQDQ